MGKCNCDRTNKQYCRYYSLGADYDQDDPISHNKSEEKHVVLPNYLNIELSANVNNKKRRKVFIIRMKCACWWASSLVNVLHANNNIP